jgi:hypothetical protein
MDGLTLAGGSPDYDELRGDFTAGLAALTDDEPEGPRLLAPCFRPRPCCRC